jgi:hypothetical protein
MVELVDGGVWANSQIGIASIEATGMINWPAERLSECKALAFERAMDGEVQAAVATLADPEAATAWSAGVH